MRQYRVTTTAGGVEYFLNQEDAIKYYRSYTRVNGNEAATMWTASEATDYTWTVRY